MTNVEFVQDVENRFFRTNQDTGANSNAMMIWNLVRNHFGLPRLRKDDLPSWCPECKEYHKSDKHEAGKYIAEGI